MGISLADCHDQPIASYRTKGANHGHDDAGYPFGMGHSSWRNHELTCRAVNTPAALQADA
jgi:hypothetical protein